MVLKGETEMKMKRWWRWGWSGGQAGSNEGGRWCSSSRPSPLWPPREASFFSAAACGSRAEETLRERWEHVQGGCDYDEHKRKQIRVKYKFTTLNLVSILNEKQHSGKIHRHKPLGWSGKAWSLSQLPTFPYFPWHLVHIFLNKGDFCRFVSNNQHVTEVKTFIFNSRDLTRILHELLSSYSRFHTVQYVFRGSKVKKRVLLPPNISWQIMQARDLELLPGVELAFGIFSLELLTWGPKTCQWEWSRPSSVRQQKL